MEFAKVQKETAEAIDNLKYEKAIEDVEKYRKTIESLNQQIEQDAKYNGSKGSSFLVGQLDRAQEALNQAEDKLANIIQLRDQAAENAIPIEIRLQEAKDNESVRQEIFEFYDKAITLANDWQAANETINYATGESRLDAFINKAQKEIAGLREDIKKNPADVNLRLKEEEKTNVLKNLLSMKRNWAVTGATSIPLIFKAQWNTAKQSLNQAKAKAQALVNAGSTETYIHAKNKAKREYFEAVQAEKDARKGSNAAWEEAREDLETKKKTYEKYWGSISSANKKASTDAKKNADIQRKAQEELNNRLKALQQKNTDETISLMQEDTEKKLAEIKNDYAKRKAEIDKQEAEFKKKNKEAGKKASLTSAQSDALSKARDLATQDFDKQTAEVNKESLDAMRDYLKEYGSLYQQKQAIAEEYEEKIAKAQTEGEKKTLQQEKKKALANFDYESISMGIDWKGLMSGVGNMSKEMLKPMLEKLDAYTNTDKFQQADTQTHQKVVDLMQEIRTYLGTDQNATWQNLAASITSFNQSILEYQTAVKNEELWKAKLANAEKDLKNGNITQEAFDKIKKSSDDASQAVVDAKNKMNTFGIKLTMVWYAAILATVVVSFPLMYRTARGAFESFDENLADAARTLGRSERWIFWRVKMPYCQQGIVAGAVLAFARALGEYGATAMICGYTPGSTATVSTTVYQLWRTNDDAGAFAWVMVNLGISAVVLLAMNWFEQKGESGAGAGAKPGAKPAAKPDRVLLGGAR